jgi:integrase
MAAEMKNVLPFNVQAIEAARPKDGKQTEYKIDGVKGLTLVIHPSGAASYFVRYSVRAGSKQLFRRVRLGSRDGMKLADARKKATALTAKVDAGDDPVAAASQLADGATLRKLWEERKAKDTKKSPRTMTYYEDALRLDVFPVLGDLPADSVTADQIATLLRGVEQRSKHAAHACRCAIGSTYKWAYKRRQVKTNPTLGLGFTINPADHVREKRVTPKELGKLWRGFDDDRGASEAMRIVLKLGLLTGQRENEVVGARIAELDLASANPTWRIPGKRMKRKEREQIVPLSMQAAALFKRAVELGGDRAKSSGFVFPASLERVAIGRDPRVPHMHRESVSRAMARVRASVGIEDVRVHDFRKAVVTWLREVKRVPIDVCDHILHHARKGVTEKHYDFGVLDGPVRDALQAWADHVESVARGAGEAIRNVAQIRG